MKLLLAQPRGFCAGVERAIQTVEIALRKWGPPIYVRHQIVHNAHVVKSLEEKGAIFVKELSEIPEGSRIVYSAHGIAPSVRLEAQKRNLIEIDATCGLVTKIHSAVKRYATKGYKIVLIGHKNHVEVIGTYGEAPEVTTIVETPADVQHLTFPPHEKLFYTTQTTLSLLDVDEIVYALQKKYPQVETLPTSSICYATTNRQMALSAIVPQVDLVLVVGDVRSSNSNRLRELADRQGVSSFLIGDADEILPSWLSGVQTIALTAGASTPEEIVHRCVQCLKELGVTTVEEVILTREEVIFGLPREVLV